MASTKSSRHRESKKARAGAGQATPGGPDMNTIPSVNDGGQWSDRQVGRKWMPVSEVLELYHQNPLNPKIHPINQQEAMLGGLEQLGWLSELRVNLKTNRFWDGHLRLGLAIGHHQTHVPLSFYELTEEEERLAILSFDETTKMGVPHLDNAKSLLAQVQTSSLKSRLAEMMEDMRERYGVSTATLPPQPTNASHAPNDHSDYRQRRESEESGNDGKPESLKVIQGYYKPDIHTGLVEILKSVGNAFGVSNMTDALQCVLLFYNEVTTGGVVTLADAATCRERVLDILKAEDDADDSTINSGAGGSPAAVTNTSGGVKSENRQDHNAG